MEELERRKRKLASAWSVMERDTALMSERDEKDSHRPERAEEALAMLEQLRTTRDTASFQSDLASWCHRPGYDIGHGMTFIHQVVTRSDPGEFAELFVETLTAPTDDADAAAKIRRFVAHVESVGQRTPRRTTLVLPLFWSFVDAERWPVAWPSSTKVLMELGWLSPPVDLDQWYLELRDIVVDVGRPPDGLTPNQVDRLLRWMDTSGTFTGLDPALADRSRENRELAEQWEAGGGRYPEGAETKAAANARAALGELKMAGALLAERLGGAFGHGLAVRVPNERLRGGGPFRTHFYVRWIVDGDGSLPRLWLRVSESEVAFGLKPGWQGKGWLARVREALSTDLPDGLEIVPVGRGHVGPASAADHEAGGSDFLIGRSVPASSALGDPAFADELVALARELPPVFDRIRAVPGTAATPVAIGGDEAPRTETVEEAEADDEDTEPVSLADLADELLLEKSFLETVVERLEDKGQVVFYGPPGTGKTFVARRLAEVLAGSPARRTIVQFHPAMSYEDFFEGYRPRAVGGQLTYDLVRGPLARIADRATEAPDLQHVLLIDEINRANLPKVLGELLYLLEYRDEAIATLYRPGETFRLPRNLGVIGTMNTADRSIALVDAALRRRFHFIPWFPEQDQLRGLLGRWLEQHGGDVRIAALVQAVNEELVDQIGEHLQIGPSYFMTGGLQESGLRRIWQYSIEPFLEEQLFGQAAEIARFRYDSVRERFWSTLNAESDSPVVADALDTGG